MISLDNGDFQTYVYLHFVRKSHVHCINKSLLKIMITSDTPERIQVESDYF